MDGWIELVFGMYASFDLSYTVLLGNSGIYKIRVLPSATLYQTPDLENFASAYRSSKPVYQLSSTMVDAQSVIKWTVVGKLS